MGGAKGSQVEVAAYNNHIYITHARKERVRGRKGSEVENAVWHRTGV
jgi:hypothetical protein